MHKNNKREPFLIDLIAGARPNFMKIAPVIDAIKKEKEKGTDINFRLVHTGQHYDKSMSGSFFEQLRIPEPDINLGAGGGTQAQQTAAIMTGYEALLMEKAPSLCLVVGDVTSTMACAITAQKMGVPVAHVEGGIRSNDWTMPEEINRLATDAVSNYFFTTSEYANTHLRNSGVSPNRIFFVGNTMIDTLLKFRPFFLKPGIWNELSLKEKSYIVLTLHRPSNVDEGNRLAHLMDVILKNTHDSEIIFPVHPRTAKVLEKNGIKHSRLNMTAPLSYLEFNYLVERAKAVVTDSGGITEETTVLGVPCMTIRKNTERPETISMGTNEVVGTEPEQVKVAMDRLYSGKWKSGSIPPLWDGKTSERIVQHLVELFTLNITSSRKFDS